MSPDGLSVTQARELVSHAQEVIAKTSEEVNATDLRDKLLIQLGVVKALKEILLPRQKELAEGLVKARAWMTTCSDSYNVQDDIDLVDSLLTKYKVS